MKISIVNSQKKVRLNLERIKNTALAALSFLDEKDAELSVYVVDDVEIKNLNYRYLGKDRATDVLAFSMREGQKLKGGEGILGDVVISAETAVSQARRYAKDTIDEIELYLIHGILHLVGYDDGSPKAKKKMFDVQDKILKLVLDKRGK